MGKETRNFRQSNSSRSGNQGASNFGQQNRGAWHVRVADYFRTKVRGASKTNG